MEKKVDKEKEPWKIPLFPRYFKTIGIALLILPFVTGLLFKYFKPNVSIESKEALKLASYNIMLLGIFLVACTRDKLEDEMTGTFRLKAMGVAFVYAVGYTLITPFIGMTWGQPVEIIKGSSVVFQMLFFYLVAFYSLKKWAGEKHG